MIGIIACTRECNLRCRYCFEEKNFKSSTHCALSGINGAFEAGLPALRRFGEELVAYNRRRGLATEFTFHGGEPLLIDADLLGSLCAFYAGLDERVRFNVQTNGTICGDKTLELLRKYRFRVGVSIDGTAELHDENRVYMDGRGSHSVVLRNIARMRGAGIDVGAMATITSFVARDTKAFYVFFAENGLDVGFNACYNSPASDHQENRIDSAQYSRFLKELFDLWIEDEDHKIVIQPFERILRAMVSKHSDMRVCQFIQDCREVNVCVDCNGDVYRCLHYCNLDDSALGNILSTGLEQIMEPFLCAPSHWDRMKQGKCADCDIQHYCYGGCPYWMDAKELTGLEGDFSCASQKAIVHYIYDRLQRRFGAMS